MKNFMIFVFSYKARLCLAYTFIALNILQVIFGCIMAIVSVYICLSVTKYLYAEKAEIQFVFTVFAMFGMHIIVQYLVGIKVVELCFVKAHKRSTKRNLYFWLILCCNTIINLMILAWLIVRISKHIVRSIRHSMEKGMRHYLSDPVWKHTIDRWQFSLRCCGVNDFQDWFRISWLDKYHIRTDGASVTKLLLSKDHLHLPVTPWSCCDVSFPMQCFHDPLQQVDSAFVWTEHVEVVEMSLYRSGCLEVIRYPIEMALVTFLVLCILLIITHVVIIVVSRFLYTSCRSAVVLHACTGRAPGWLFSRDCLAERRGRTLSEIMSELDHDSESYYEESEDDYARRSRTRQRYDEVDTESVRLLYPVARRESNQSRSKHRGNRQKAHSRRRLSAHSTRPPSSRRPKIPPRRESMLADDQRAVNASSSLRIDSAALVRQGYDVQYAQPRPKRPHGAPARRSGADEESDACERSRRNSARGPVCSRTEDVLMLR